MSTAERHDPQDVPAAVGGYSQGVEVAAGARLLFVSGQIPETPQGSVPDGFEAQCRLAWANLVAVLRDAGMEPADLVKVSTFLTHPDQVPTNRRVRQEVLGGARPALTVVVVQTLESRWLLEIEAVAARA
jgi:2-iminobutanoate/2-iminopropanoate deaminase